MFELFHLVCLGFFYCCFCLCLLVNANRSPPVSWRFTSWFRLNFNLNPCIRRHSSIWKFDPWQFSPIRVVYKIITCQKHVYGISENGLNSVNNNGLYLFINVWTPTLCFLRHFEYQKRRDEVRFYCADDKTHLRWLNHIFVAITHW